jgi:hypothetical protein
MDGQSPIIPEAPDAANVQAAIDALRVVTADLQPDTLATREAICDAINALLLRCARPGGTPWLDRLTRSATPAA